jgi:hypothetical protein
MGPLRLACGWWMVDGGWWMMMRFANRNAISHHRHSIGKKQPAAADRRPHGRPIRLLRSCESKLVFLLEFYRFLSTRTVVTLPD